MADSGELVQTRRHGRVLEVRICREERRNAVDRRVADGLDAAFNLLEDDPKLWVGVLTGTGRVFSAGSDLTAGGDYVTERGGAYGLVRRQRRKPLIAAVEGAALGGGLELVLACDLVVASTSARFGLPEVKLGLVARCGGLFRGPRALPVNLAREMVLTGDPIDAQRAHAHGLVNRLTAPGHALPTALELADRICDNSPSAVRASLAAMDAVLSGDDPAAWAATEKADADALAAPDAAEGVAAFLEHRRPRWTSA
ncbi:enoyl-CoA hydratase-related protein [Streptacidiphilus monticola]|uniref:Enoyl-CoA hydratase-related protein n=1 Tax=Streptacidiphilus monticola TaxID=2161674 RepID=A0ABW1G8V3_9ACTN